MESFTGARAKEPAPAVKAGPAQPSAPRKIWHRPEAAPAPAEIEPEPQAQQGNTVPPLEHPVPADITDETEAGSPQLKARLLYRQAEGLNTQGRTSEAIRSLEQSIKLDPDSPKSFEAWMLLGDLRQGNPAWSTRAIEAYQAAARALPKRGEPWRCMGQLYHRKGFATNAIGCFRRALELDPSLELPDYALSAEPPSPAAPREGVMGRFLGLFGGEKR